MQKKEAKSSVLFRHWVFANSHKLRSSTFEMKDSSGKNSILFSCVEDHQVDFNMAIRWGKKGVLIRNESGTIGAPDYSYYKNSPSYIVIKYPLGFTLIDIETFTLEKQRSQKKSLTWERACEIAWKVIPTASIKRKVGLLHLQK